MKRLLLIVLPLLLIIGCSKPINESTLINRGEHMYEANATKPYTGQVFELYANGQKAFEGSYKDGFRHGDWTYYTDVGDGKYSVTYTAGTYNVAVFTDNLGTDYTGSPITGEPKQDGQFFVLRNEYYFSKYPESFGTYKDGKRDGLWTTWYDNGQKKDEGTYKDGKSIGKWTYWYEDGREIVPIIPDVVTVQGGTFQMGSNSGDIDEKPVHSVTVSDYSMSKTEVTFEQYDAFCTLTGSDKPDDEGWGRGDRPVINVNWHDAVAFCEWMSKVTGKTYRLPTEAEWEYAARGGNKSKGYIYSGGNDLDAVGWYDDNYGRKTHPVAQKQPNELGLYDMSGNVWEWCSDWYDKVYYSGSPQTDPQGSNSGSSRVLRGGCWSFDLVSSCRVADRGRCDPDRRYGYYGFRLVLSQD
jgi:sulfatase modifying factor 1